MLKAFPDSAVDAVVTDPPYGLSKEPDAAEVLRHWLAGDDYVHNGGGFMGKSWDSFVPGPSVWREVLRVLKPGGHALVFAGSRTQDLMSMALRLAGFEIRDTAMWLYGSGFPKSLDVSKVTGSEEWAGYGTALKPAYEPITIARKPLDGTVADNVLTYGTGALNIDGCRVDGTRWPANAMHDGLSEEWARYFYCPKTSKADRNAGCEHLETRQPHEITGRQAGSAGQNHPRACIQTGERKNHHPTVKPAELMRYLCRLVGHPGALILDPFAGSGSTGRAAILEGFNFIGIEREADYVEIARARLRHAKETIR